MTGKAAARKAARQVFLLHQPIGPWPCHFCGQLVDRWGRHPDDGHIHHVDEDWSNNDLSNVVAAHCHCHYSYHANRQKWPEERRTAHSARFMGHVVSEETREKISSANKGGTGGTGFTGRRHSDETKTKMRAAAARRRAQRP